MVEVGEVLDRVPASVEKGGCEVELGSAVDVFDESQGDWPGFGLGVFPVQTAKRVGPRGDGDELILLAPEMKPSNAVPAFLCRRNRGCTPRCACASSTR